MIEAGIPPEWKAQWEQIVVQLHDPVKLQVTTLAVVVLVGLGAVYKPMSDHLVTVRRELKESQARLALVRKVEAMRTTKARLSKELPPNGDSNFWGEYVLQGIRDSGIRLRSFEARPKSKVRAGPYVGLELKLELEGGYSQIQGFVSWVEYNQWYMRVLDIQLDKKPSWIYAKITIAVLAAKGKSK